MDVVKAGDEVRDLAVGGGRGIKKDGAELALGELMTQGGDYVFEFAGVAAMKDDVEAVAGELGGETFANAIASAGDENPRFFTVVVLVEGGGAQVEIDEAGEAEKEEDDGGDTSPGENNEYARHGTQGTQELRPSSEVALYADRASEWCS